jgi:hypothetical protein
VDILTEIAGVAEKDMCFKANNMACKLFIQYRDGNNDLLHSNCFS